MKKIILLLFLTSICYARQTPYKVDDPATHENFNVMYNSLYKHSKHPYGLSTNKLYFFTQEPTEFGSTDKGILWHTSGPLVLYYGNTESFILKAAGADKFRFRQDGGFNVATDGPASPATDTLYADNIVKVWAVVSSTGTAVIKDGFGISSITDNGPGLITFNFDNNFANTNYAAFVSISNDGNGGRFAVLASYAVGSVQVRISNAADSANVDNEHISFMAIGEQ